MLVYTLLCLHLTRGWSFITDDLTWVVESDGFSPRHLLDPHNGHLILVNRAFYSAMLATTGPDPLVVRLWMIFWVSASSVLLYVLVARRLGPLLALVPALVVLFLGSTPEVLSPNCVSFPQAVAFGLGALLAVERGSRGGDVAACSLLLLSVFSLEVGLAFAVAVAVPLLVDPARRRRLWVVLVPVAAFAAWWLWARQFDEGFTDGWNVLLIPSFSADGAASATSALSGFPGAAADASSIDPNWGRVLLPCIAAGFVIAIGRGRGSEWMLLATVLLASLCAGFALGYSLFRAPNDARYAYPIVFAILLASAEALRGVRPSRLLVVAAVLVVCVSVAGNVNAMRNHGAKLRSQSEFVRGAETAVEVGGERIDPSFEAGDFFVGLVEAGDYLAFADREGGLGYPATDVANHAVAARVADETLLSAYAPQLQPAAGSLSSCETVEGEGAVRFPLPAAGVVLEADTSAAVALSRFGADPIALQATARSGEPVSLVLPRDNSMQPWLVTLTGTDSVRVCEPGREVVS